MSRFRIILYDLLLAAAAIVLYSPGLLGLRFDDPDWFRQGLSIVALIGLGFLFYLINISGDRRVLISDGSIEIALPRPLRDALSQTKTDIRHLSDQAIKTQLNKCLRLIFILYDRVEEDRALSREKRSEMLEELDRNLAFYIQSLENLSGKAVMLFRYWTGSPKDTANLNVLTETLNTMHGLLSEYNDQQSRGDLANLNDLVQARALLDGYLKEWKS